MKVPLFGGHMLFLSATLLVNVEPRQNIRVGSLAMDNPRTEWSFLAKSLISMVHFPWPCLTTGGYIYIYYVYIYIYVYIHTVYIYTKYDIIYILLLASRSPLPRCHSTKSTSWRCQYPDVMMCRKSVWAVSPALRGTLHDIA